jgi:predicted phosphoribosyltransferase
MSAVAFADRANAGRELARVLSKYRGQDPIVLALPRGGVPVAAEVAAALGAPLDIVISRKIGVPFQPELAMGAVVDGPEPTTVRNEDVIAAAGVSEESFTLTRNQELAEIQRRRHRYVGGRPHPDLKGRVAIIVDDGVATGATTRAALRALRRQDPRVLVLAVPVAPTSTLNDLRGEADEIVCLEDHEPFGAISWFYDRFDQVSDEEVISILSRFSATKPDERPALTKAPSGSPSSAVPEAKAR